MRGAGLLGGVDGKKRIWGFELCDLLEAYPGWAPADACRFLGRKWDHYARLSLAQNIDRCRRRYAAKVGAGVGATAGDLGPEWAQVLTRTPDEANELHAKMDGDRRWARARAARLAGE